MWARGAGHGARAAFDAAGVPPKKAWHALRHTAATSWVHAGENHATVAKLLGQSRASFTLERYVSVRDDDLPGGDSLAAAHPAAAGAGHRIRRFGGHRVDRPPVARLRRAVRGTDGQAADIRCPGPQGGAALSFQSARSRPRLRGQSTGFPILRRAFSGSGGHGRYHADLQRVHALSTMNAQGAPIGGACIRPTGGSSRG